MEKQMVNLTIFLIKDYVESFEGCLKNSRSVISSNLKKEIGIVGKIFYCDSSKKTYLDELSSDTISLKENSSKKAVVLVKIDDRIMAIVFGFGRSFLKEEYIVLNFGFKVAFVLFRLCRRSL